MLLEISPLDILRSDRWRSVLMTTYSLSLSFLEAVPLQALGDNRRDVTILADIEGYRASLSETGASSAGVGYDVIPISVLGSGVFHPKVTLLASHDGELRALVGSGNLTMGGWGFNTEVAEYLNPDTDPEAFTDLADFLLSLGEAFEQGRLRSDASALAPLQKFADICLAAGDRESGGPTRVLHSVNRALAPQVVEMASELGGARALTVLSPYFGGPKAVVDLAQDLGCKTVNVFVAPKVPFWFDFDAARTFGLAAQPATSQSFSGEKLSHAKAFDSGLLWSMRNRWWVIGITVLCFLLAVFCMRFVQNHQYAIRVVIRNAGRDVLQQHGFTGFRRRNNQTTLATANWRR